MKKDVLITVKGKYSRDDSDDVIEMTTLGALALEKGKYSISYREPEETGMETTTTVNVDNDHCITLTRDGAVRSLLTLEKGRRHLCTYDTPEGSMIVGVFAKQIDANLGQSGGQLDFKYTLDINSELASNNEVHITVKEV